MSSIQADKVLKTLHKLKPELQSHYFVKEIGLFGSVLRGDQTRISDIDILVEFSKPVGFFINWPRKLSVVEDRVPPTLSAVQAACHVFVCTVFLFVESWRHIARVFSVELPGLSAGVCS